MEKRFYLGLVILLLLLALGVGAASGMQAIHTPVESALEEAANLAMEDNLDQALPLAREAYGKWQQYRTVTAAFADHTPMDDTDTLFQEMLVYGELQEVPHFAACCRQLATMTHSMYDAHSLTWWNLL